MTPEEIKNLEKKIVMSWKTEKSLPKKKNKFFLFAGITFILIALSLTVVTLQDNSTSFSFDSPSNFLPGFLSQAQGENPNIPDIAIEKRNKTDRQNPNAVTQEENITVFSDGGNEILAYVLENDGSFVKGRHWVDTERNKFGLDRIGSPTLIKNHTFVFESYLQLEKVGGRYYYRTGNNGIRVDVSDICDRYFHDANITTGCDYETEKEEIVEQVDDEGELINITKINYKLLVHFQSNGTIDPTFEREILETNSYLTNVTFEPGNFTHLITSDPDLIVYYPFDRDDNITSYDYTNESLDGTYTNGVTGDSLYGLAYQGDGVGDWISLGTGNVLNTLATDMTYSVWVKKPSCTEATQFIFNQRTTGSNTFLNFDLDVQSSGVYRALGTGAAPTLTTPCADDTWIHLAVARNSTTLLLYANGTLVSSAADTLITPSASANNYIGTIDGSSTLSFNGSIDELMVFNRTLTASEISDIYNNQTSRFVNPGTQEFFPFDITAGNNTINVTGGDQQTYLNSNFSIAYDEWEVANEYDETDVSLIGSWHVDGSANSSSGLYNGTLVAGATFNESGQYDQALKLDGDGQWINVATNSALTPTTLTIAGWIKREGDVSGSVECPFGMDDVTNRNWQFCVDPASDNSLTPRMLVFIGGGANFATSPTGINTDEWTHVVGVANGTDVLTYVNGVLVASATAVGNVDQDPADFRIGDIGNGVNEFNGSIDEVYYFNTSLTSEQIKQLYVNGKANWTRTEFVPWVSGAEITIQTTTTKFAPVVKLNADSNNFYSPTLGLSQNITFETFDTAVGPSPPTISSVTLNATSTGNLTTDNLTGFVNGASDVDGDNVTFVYNWYKDDVLNATSVFINDSELLAYYPYNNDTFDYASFHNGTLFNEAFVNETGGIISGGVKFDGVGDVVKTEDNPFSDAQVGTEGSISGWVKFDSFFGTGSVIADIEGWAMIGYGDLGSTASTVLKCRNYDGAVKVAEGDFTPVADVWYHVVSTWDGTNLRCYINGELNDTTLTGSITPDVTSLPFTTGLSANAGEPLNGTVDEVQVYGRTLTATEVKQIYLGSAYSGDVMDSSQTTVGDNWTLGVVPLDYANVGTEVNSSLIEILETPSTLPTITSVTLNATSTGNTTDDNLTGFVNGASDPNGLNMSFVYNWYKETALYGSSVFIDDSNLSLYFPFNNDTIDYAGSQNGTPIGTTIDTQSGRIGAGWNTVPGGTLDINGYTSTAKDYSFMMWHNHTDTDTTFDYMFDAESGRLILAFNGPTTNKIQFYTASNGWNVIADSPSVQVWHHYAWIFDSGNSQFSLFVDGVQLGSNLTYTGTNLGGDIGIGGGYDNAAQSNGEYDEFILYERVLSPDEIMQHYRGSAYGITGQGGRVLNSSETTTGDNWTLGVKPIDYANVGLEVNSSSIEILSGVVPDTTPPNVTSLTETPTDPATYSPGATYEFNATIVDDVAVQTVLLNFNGTNYTASNISSVYNVTLVNLPVGTYNYTWFANDTSGNINNSENGTYTVVDLTPPSIEAPGNSSILTNEILDVVFNATDDIAIDTWFIDDTTNFTINSTGGLTNNTQLSVDYYQINVSVNDTAGNINSTLYSVNVTPLNVSLRGVDFDFGSFEFNTDVYITAVTFQFNTSTINESYILMMSENVRNAAAGAGTTDVFMNVTVDNTEVFEGKLRTVDWSAAQNDVGSVASINNFTVGPTGTHNLTIQYRREGTPRPILIDNKDISMGKLETNIFTNVDGEIETNFGGSTSSTTLEQVVNFTVNNTHPAPTYHSMVFSITASGATTAACRLTHDGTHSSPFITRSMSGAGDTGSVALTFLQSEPDASHVMELECLSTTGETITLNGTFLAFALDDRYGNEISFATAGNATSNYTTEIALGAGTHLIAQTEFKFKDEGDSVFTSAYIGFRSTSGTQTPTIIVNSTFAGCNSTKERFLEDDTDFGNIGIFHVCTNSPTAGDTHNFSLYVEVPAGESLNVTDESINLFEVRSFDIATINTPPVVSIITPEENVNVTGTIDINWTISDSQIDTTLTNVTANNGTDTVIISSNHFNGNTTTNWDTTTVSDGLWNITVTATENETTDLFNGSDTVQVFVDNTAPIITIDSPLNQTYNLTATIDLNVSAVDSLSIDTWWWTNNSGVTNNTFTPNVTIVWPENSTTLFVYANDSVGNIGSNSVTFFVNTTTTLSIAQVILNATSVNNLTSDNLTGHIINATSGNGNMSFVYNWYKESGLNVTNVFINSDDLSAYFPYDNDFLDYKGGRTVNETHNTPYLTTDAKIGNNSIHFDSTGSFGERVRYLNEGAFEITQGSVTMWFKSMASITPYQYLLASRGDAGNSRIYFNIDNFNDFGCGFSDDFNVPRTNNNIEGDNLWHHATITWNSTTMKCYLDNTEISNYVATLSAVGGTINFGSLQASPDSFGFDGNIDDVGIYNKTLTPTEIEQIYIAGLQGGINLTSNQTTTGDNWTLGVIPVTPEEIGTEVNSTAIEILPIPEQERVLQFWGNKITNQHIANITSEGNFWLAANINVNGCLQYNCSQVGGCVTLGVCLT